MQDPRFEELDACPNCGGQDFKSFCRHTHDPYLHAYDPALDEREVKWWFCNGCGLLFQNPRLNAQSLGEFYAQGYRKGEPAKNVLEGKFYDAALVVDFIRSKWTPKNNAGKCLDIGSGEGCLVKTLAAVNKAGGPKWDAYGVEPSEIYGQYARERLMVQVATEEFTEKSWRGMDFRLITTHHVIEHIHDFKSFLRLAKKRLRPEGRLFVGTPSAELPWGEGWSRPTNTVFETYGATHLQLFTSRALVRALNDCGFFVDSLDHYLRGTMCLARHAKDGERNELAGKDDPSALVSNVKRGYDMWKQYQADPEHRHPFKQAELGILPPEASGTAASGTEVAERPKEEVLDV